MLNTRMLRSALVAAADASASIRLIDVGPHLLAHAWQPSNRLHGATAVPSNVPHLTPERQALIAKLMRESLQWSGATHVCLPPAYVLAASAALSEAADEVGQHGATCIAANAACAFAVASTRPLYLVDYPLALIGADNFYGCPDVNVVRSQQDDVVQNLVDGSASHSADVVGWLRSSLGCRYEGGHAQPILVAEEVCRLLSIGCHHVILEEGVGGMAPRWLETVLKTIHAVGGSSEQLGLSAANGALSKALVHCALSFGVSTFVGSSVVAPATAPGLRAAFPGSLPASPIIHPSGGSTARYVPKRVGSTMADPRIGMHALLEAALGYQEQSTGITLTDDEVSTIEQSLTFTSSFNGLLAQRIE